MNGETFQLREFVGVYVHFMDDRLLPKLDSKPDHSPLRRRTRALHDAFSRWLKWLTARSSTAPIRKVRTAPSPTRRN